MVNGINQAKEKEWEFKFGLMEVNMKATGLKTRLILMEDLFMPLGIATLANGDMTKRMELVLFTLLMGENILDRGRMISSMALEQKYGLILQSMKVALKMGKDIILVHSILLMEANILVNFIKIKYKGKEFINGMMDEDLMDFGLVVK